MRLSRRDLLTLLGTALLPTAAVSTAATASPVRYVSARAGADGQERYFVSGFDDQGRVRFDLPLPGRGHATALHPNGREAVLVARRPGRFLVVIDLKRGLARQQVQATPGRHFCGHGVFARNGRLFYTTENDFETGRGVIGVRDAQAGYSQVAELASYGIGPHELLLGREGRTLIVANGGILTHPDTGRAKLNLDTMSPSLVHLDAETGDLLAQYKLPAELHQLSIRHLAAGADGSVWMVMQYEGPRSDDPPLIGLHRAGEPIRLLRAPPDVQRRMRNYCGSVSTDCTGRWLASSCPRGNLVTFWTVDGLFAGSAEATDGCGLAPGRFPSEILMSSGTGALWRFRAMDGSRETLAAASPPEVRWDNHLLQI